MALIFEFALGYDIPIWSDLQENKYVIKTTPQLKLSWYGEGQISFHIGKVNITIKADGDIWKITPFDFSFWWDPIQPERYCFGMTYAMEAITFNVLVQEEVEECHFGVFGLFQDPADLALDCFKRVYKLDRPDQNTTRAYIDEMPVYQFKPIDWFDARGDYIRFRCVNWYSADYPSWTPGESKPDGLDYADKISNYEVYANERPDDRKKIFDPNGLQQPKVIVPSKEAVTSSDSEVPADESDSDSEVEVFDNEEASNVDDITNFGGPTDAKDD